MHMRVTRSVYETVFAKTCISLVLLVSALIQLPALAAHTHKSKHPSSVEHSGAASHPKEFCGLADYYHHTFYGQKTASGQVLLKHKLTAAHRTLPFGTLVKVTNPRNRHSCVVVINDRGPFTRGKVIDLSHAAACELDVVRAGTAQVACKIVENDEEFH